MPALPTSFVVNQDGGVVQKHVGMLKRDEIQTEVRSLPGLPVNAKIENFVDTGQIFLKNAERATELPDVDLKGLTPGPENGGAQTAQLGDLHLRLPADDCAVPDQ